MEKNGYSQIQTLNELKENALQFVYEKRLTLKFFPITMSRFRKKTPPEKTKNESLENYPAMKLHKLDCLNVEMLELEIFFRGGS